MNAYRESLNIFGNEFTTADDVIEALIDYRNKDGAKLIDKFSIESIVLQLNRIELEKIQAYYRGKPLGLDILEFCRLLVNTIEHNHDEVVYLVVIIIDLFQEICAINSVKQVKFSHLTNYLCQVAQLLKYRIFYGQPDTSTVRTRLLPQYRSITPLQSVRKVDVEAPTITGDTEECIIKLTQQRKIKTDRYKHYGTLNYYGYSYFSAFFDNRSHTILALDALADFIGVYNLNCILIGRITPSCTKFKKDINILCFSYSERQERVGAVLKDYSMVFWDLNGSSDGYKMFSVAEHCTDFQSNIWFLDGHNLWVTGDRSGHLFTWNLEEEKPLLKIQMEPQTRVADICYLSCLNLVALSQYHCMQEIFKRNSKHSHEYMSKRNVDGIKYKVFLYNIWKGCRISYICLSNRGIHTVHFSTTYQILLSCGYYTKIDVLEVNPYFFDISVKGTLVGHESMISTFTPIERTPMVASADDKGKIKIWDIRSYKCIQTVDFGDQVYISRIVDLIEVGKLVFTGSRINVIDFDTRAQEIKLTKPNANQYPIRIYYEPNNSEFIIFTKKDIRVCDIGNGTIKNIYCGFFDKYYEIIAAKYVSAHKQYILSSDRGYTNMYCSLNGQKMGNMLSHQSYVSAICYDSLNKLYITASWDSNIIIQKQLTAGTFTEIRRLSDNFNKKYINIMEVSVYHNLIAIGCSLYNSIYFWDYYMGKLLKGVSLRPDEYPTSIAFINGFNLVAIGTSLSTLYLIKVSQRELQTDLTLFASMTLKYSSYEALSCLLVDTRIMQQSGKSELILSYIVVGTSRGSLISIDITNLIKAEPIVEHSCNRLNYNGYILIKENFNNYYSKKKFKLLSVNEKPKHIISPQSVNKIKAHNGNITSVIMLEEYGRCRISAATDSRIKIWKKEGELLCDWNINMPLPYKWDLIVKKNARQKDKLTLALKVIKSIMMKFGGSMSRTEENILRVDWLLANLRPKKVKTYPEKISVRLLQNYISKKYVHYDKIKRTKASEIVGSSLKEMAFYKRIRTIQQALRNQERDMEEHERMIYEIQIRNTRSMEREQIMQLLQPRYLMTQQNSPVDKNLTKLIAQLNGKESSEGENKENYAIRSKEHMSLVKNRKRNFGKNTFEKYYLNNGRETPVADEIREGSALPRDRKKIFYGILSDMNKQLEKSKKVSYRRMLRQSLQLRLHPTKTYIKNEQAFFPTEVANIRIRRSGVSTPL